MTDKPEIMILQTTTGPVQIKDASREQLINALETIVWELSQLRATIQTMRNPTDEMLDAFGPFALPPGFARKAWQAAIDKALEP